MSILVKHCPQRWKKNKAGLQVKLPVDGFYKELGLVIEYRERQHTESVSLFDKPNKMTVSGVDRGKQRIIYDERRRRILPKNGFTLIEISYSDLAHNSKKRLTRNSDKDEMILTKMLKRFIKGDTHNM